MKEIIQTLIFFTPQIVLSIGCVMMALRGIDGWGWILFVLFLLIGSTSAKFGG